jgi:hypothetical protein
MGKKDYYMQPLNHKIESSITEYERKRFYDKSIMFEKLCRFQIQIRNLR